MKGIKNIFFCAEKENLTDKAFRQSIAISIFGIVLCMIALCSATWAWFSAAVSSNTNSVQSANCAVTVSVANSGTAIDADNGKYTFEKDKIYDIKITASGSAKSAYCILVVEGMAYYTTQIPASAENGLTFTLRFSEDKEIEIITRWGTSSKPETERIFKNDGYYYNLEESEPITITTDANSSAEASTETQTDVPTPETSQ